VSTPFLKVATWTHCFLSSQDVLLRAFKNQLLRVNQLVQRASTVESVEELQVTSVRSLLSSFSSTWTRIALSSTTSFSPSVPDPKPFPSWTRSRSFCSRYDQAGPAGSEVGSKMEGSNPSRAGRLPLWSVHFNPTCLVRISADDTSLSVYTGIADELGVLRENEVFCRFDNPLDAKNGAGIVRGSWLVFRSPARSSPPSFDSKLFSELMTLAGFP